MDEFQYAGINNHFRFLDCALARILAVFDHIGQVIHGVQEHIIQFGHFRFHVVGDGWMLDSNPFEVVAGTLTVSATRGGNTITARSNCHAPRGFRLLDMASPSNVPVPLRAQNLTVTAFAGAVMVGTPQSVTTDASGAATVDLGAAAGTVTRIDVRDSLGNIIYTVPPYAIAPGDLHFVYDVIGNALL